MEEKALQKTEQKSVKEWLSSDHFKDAVRASLPSHLTPDRFIRVALTALMKTPKLAQCTENSIFKCMLDLSSLGLEPDGRRAHLIPYENRKTGVTEAQLIIDYKGLIELAKRSGEIKMWRAELVCENDEFSWDTGIVTHKVDWLRPRGKSLAVYSHVKNQDDIDDYEVMTMDQVELIRKRSKSGQSGPWVNDFDEMAKKTVMRRHSKRLTLSPEFNDALQKDDDKIDEDFSNSFANVSLMPRRLSEVQNQENVVVTEAVKEEPAQPGDGVPNFNDAPANFNPNDKISKNQADEIRKKIIKHRRQAGAFNEFLKNACGTDKIENVTVGNFDKVLNWIETD